MTQADAAPGIAGTPLTALRLPLRGAHRPEAGRKMDQQWTTKWITSGSKVSQKMGTKWITSGPESGSKMSHKVGAKWINNGPRGGRCVPHTASRLGKVDPRVRYRNEIEALGTAMQPGAALIQSNAF